MATNPLRPRRAHGGQALMELAVGLFSLALVASILFSFARYIASSLKAQNELREGGRTNSKSDSVEVDAPAAEYAIGTKTLKIKERVELPSTLIGK